MGVGKVNRGVRKWECNKVLNHVLQKLNTSRAVNPFTNFQKKRKTSCNSGHHSPFLRSLFCCRGAVSGTRDTQRER